MGAGHSWPGGIATGRGDFSGETLCSTESAYQRGFSGPTGDRSRRTPHIARVVLTARLGENVVQKRFGVFISTSIIATYIFEVLKTCEGLVAKRTNSEYESGQRSGTWVKFKITKAQEFVIGAYILP